MPSNHYGEMESVLGDSALVDPGRVRHHVIGVAKELDRMTDRIEALEAAREQKEQDMAGEQGESPEVRAQAQCPECRAQAPCPECRAQAPCPECPQVLYGDTALEAQDALDFHLQNSHGPRKIRAAATMGRPSRKVIRWTITGEGGPLARAMTWSKVLDLVERAEKLGLRVEVAELDEEER